MKKLVFIISTILLSGCTQAQITNHEFAKLTNLFIEIEKYPYNYKKDTPSPIFQNAQQHRISFELAKKYLGFTNWDWHSIEYEYNGDDDILTKKIIENPPLAHIKIISDNYVSLIYRNSRGIENDTFKVVLETFDLKGILINSMLIGGQFTHENDWKDVVFINDNTFKIFYYLPNLENYNIKNGAYYVIDENQPQTIVEISDYQIDENGKINLIKTHPKQYLKKFVSFYRSYHENSDDPMNKY